MYTVNNILACIKSYARFRSDIRRNFFTEWGVKHWNRLPRAGVESLRLEVLKEQLDMAFSAKVVFGSMLNSMILEVFSSFNDSVISIEV